MRGFQLHLITFLVHFPNEDGFSKLKIPLSFREVSCRVCSLFLNQCQLLTEKSRQDKAFGNEYGNTKRAENKKEEERRKGEEKKAKKW